MTVAALPATVDYFENGSTTSFAVPFRFSAASDLRPVRYFADGSSAPLTLATDFTATGGATDAGGTLTVVAPAAAGTRLRITRSTERTQQTTYTTGDRFPAVMTERTFDRSMLIDQEQDVSIAEIFTRGLFVPVGWRAPVLPSLSDADGKVLGYANGGFVWAENDGVAIAGDVARAETAANVSVAAAGVATDGANTVNAAFALGPRLASKSLDRVVTASTTLAPDPDLVVPLPARALVVIKGFIAYSTSAVADFKWRHAVPAGASIVLTRRSVAPGDNVDSGVLTDVAASATDIVIAGASGVGTIAFEATIRNGGTAGSFVFSSAQNTSDAAPTTTMAGSRIDYRYLAVAFSVGFTASGNSIAKLGSFPAPASFGGHNLINAGPAYTEVGNAYIETMVAGSACQVQILGGSYTFSVDNGPSVTATAPAGWNFVDLFTGLSDKPHRIKLQAQVYDDDITFRVTGLAPAVFRPADIPSFYPLGLSPYSDYIAGDAVPSLFSMYSTPVQTRVWPSNSACGFGARFRATTTTIQAWVYDGPNQSPLVVLRDGTPIAIVTLDGSTGRMRRVVLATGLSDTHDYEIIPISTTGQSYIFAILVDTLEPVAQTARLVDAYYGDSIIAMGNTNTTDARLGDASLLARATGRAAVRVGVGGTGVSVDPNGDQSNKYGRNNTGTVTGLTSAPDRVFVCYGVNDMFFGVPLATFQADYQTMLANLRTALPSAKIVARAILPQTRNTDTLRQSYNARIAAAVTAVGDGNTVFVGTDGWINTSTDLVDNVHPNILGYAKIATQAQAAL